MKSWLPPSPRNRLYAGLAGYGAAGAAWLTADAAAGGGFTVCPCKLLTGIPCPACGSTRAVLALFRGEDVLAYNPLGVVTLGLAVVVFVALCRDLATGSDGLYRAWCRREQLLRRPLIASLGIAALAGNWLWSISKGL